MEFQFPASLENHDPFHLYQHQLATTFDALPPQGKFKELALRIAAVAVFPIVYPVLAISSGVNYLFNPNKQLKSKINWLKQHRPPHWQRIAATLIKRSRYENSFLELSRLRSMSALTPSRENQLDISLSKVWIKEFSLTKGLQAKKLFAQALELKDLYRETHDVFIHAQANKWVIFSHLVKELSKVFHPEKDLHHYKFLRAPCNTVDMGFLDSCWNYLFGPPKKPATVQDYVNSKWYINDDNTKVREELLSVDAHFYNFHAYESALFFLINNDNIFNNAEVIANFSKKVIKHFCPSFTDERKLTKCVARITQAAFKKAEVGNLFVICLPKEESHKAHYRAHPFGPPCKCHPANENRSVLDKLQNQEVLHGDTKCKDPHPKVPQFRLYTPMLKPGDGKAIYLLTPLSKTERQGIKNPVKEVAKEVHAFAIKTKKKPKG